MSESKDGVKRPVKDSGRRRGFESGAVRDAEGGKVEPGLVSPLFLERLGWRMSGGAEKYDPRNWEKGMPLDTYWRSLWRHLVEFGRGDGGEDHLAGAAFNLMALMHTELAIHRGLLPSSLNDLPGYTQGALMCRDNQQPTPVDNKEPRWVYIFGRYRHPEIDDAEARRKMMYLEVTDEALWKDRLEEMGFRVIAPLELTQHLDTVVPAGAIMDMELATIHDKQPIMFGRPGWRAHDGMADSAGSVGEVQEAKRVGCTIIDADEIGDASAMVELRELAGR